MPYRCPLLSQPYLYLCPYLYIYPSHALTTTGCRRCQVPSQHPTAHSSSQRQYARTGDHSTASLSVSGRTAHGISTPNETHAGKKDKSIRQDKTNTPLPLNTYLHPPSHAPSGIPSDAFSYTSYRTSSITPLSPTSTHPLTHLNTSSHPSQHIPSHDFTRSDGRGLSDPSLRPSQ